jgi:acyl carrier protein
METQAIYERLNEIFRDIFDDDTISLTPETTADDIPDWDSFNHVNVTVACEAAFGIRFKGSELEELHNVGELVDAIASKLG